MKLIIATITFLVVSSSAMAQSLDELPLTLNSLNFLGQCSGITTTMPQPGQSFTETDEMALMISHLTCMTYVQGVIDSHLLTMHNYAEKRRDWQNANDRNFPRIDFTNWFCIDPTIRSDALLAGIIVWINENEQAVGNINKMTHDSPREAALATILVALGTVLPCQ